MKVKGIHCIFTTHQGDTCCPLQ